jgi:Ni,Fe-hydrogenase III large subunit/Ni,Fe-hydrogenase III component G
MHDWLDQAVRPSDAPGAVSIAGAPKVWNLIVTGEQWRQAVENIAAGGGRLLSLWASRDTESANLVRAAFAGDGGVLVLTLRLDGSESQYPGLERSFPSASRMQRAIADLCGLHSTGGDRRPWLRHSAWPASFHPLRDTALADQPSSRASHDYAFVRVEGEGVHEIPVGPVHAGIIEPGHFRFSIVGEKVLRLEQRLGYVHKGIERRFTELPLLEGHRLAARVSGDSAVAYSWAYCQALEGMNAARVPPRALWLRALGLELERIANHLGDLGALGNDAGFAVGLAQFSRLKEQLLRATEHALGQRYLMDLVVPGGTRVDLSAAAAADLTTCVQSLAAEVETLRAIYDEHAGMRDRFAGAGTVTPALAAKLGLTGLAGRASGQAFDLRCDLPCEPYPQLSAAKVVRAEGDVAARVAVRFDEVVESIRLVKQIVQNLPPGGYRWPMTAAPEGSWGIGLIEGWRGPVLVALEAGEAGRIRRCHPHDPSWQNWLVLEHAIIDNIVPDFPLINKSFNLSYSGHDL